MKRVALFLASTAFVTPALAADVIYEAPPAPAAPMAIEPIQTTTTWTGLYVGGQAGVAFGNDSEDISFDPDADGVFDDASFDDGDEENNAGFVGGAHIGYDYQMGNVVLGGVADINYIDAETSRSYTVTDPLSGATGTFGINEEIDYLGTVRARLGYAFDSVLVYGTGGLAYAGYDRETFAPGATSAFGSTYTIEEDGDDDIDVGYSVGGGVDVMATQNLSFGVEYLYTNLGSNDYSVTATNGLSEVEFTTESNDDDVDFHTIWAKASYRFN